MNAHASGKLRFPLVVRCLQKWYGKYVLLYHYLPDNKSFRYKVGIWR